jgi:hypothetical protein
MPGDVPVKQPSMVEFTVDVKTAEALGPTIPRNVPGRSWTATFTVSNPDSNSPLVLSSQHRRSISTIHSGLRL